MAIEVYCKMIDNIALTLNIPPLNSNQLASIHEEVKSLVASQNEAIVSWNKGMKVGPRNVEDKQKISNTLKNHPVSDETRQKISNKIKLNNQMGINGFCLGHASKAGRIGGLSKSPKKIESVRANQQKSIEKIKNTVWMIHTTTLVRKRVSQDLISLHEEQGFIKGSKI